MLAVEKKRGGCSKSEKPVEVSSQKGMAVKGNTGKGTSGSLQNRIRWTQSPNARGKGGVCNPGGKSIEEELSVSLGTRPAAYLGKGEVSKPKGKRKLGGERICASFKQKNHHGSGAGGPGGGHGGNSHKREKKRTFSGGGLDSAGKDVPLKGSN